ncbi:Phage major capsid protein [Rubellimicrobium mesophilum DSM 19309]|uniref:Phage major capsid protein n=1 Tax=Rubellimicrobium mesophilum DSM 19309 TaxID=442562 RepID=A0A017HTP9_9RHOB|nr:phage major capsid protein [Rubellimicrobium mesophilum]EYD77099.1 Phage major capsid protein [Rubellimicrobium mesophilum DSM 19309]
MTTPETISRAGEDLSPSPEVKAAVTGFLAEFKAFSDDVATRLQHHEDQMTKLDRKMTHAAFRPMLSAETQEAPHQKAFDTYLRNGDDAGMRSLGYEAKAMSTAVASDGGVLVSPQAAETIRNVLVSTASIRSIASVVQVEAGSLDILIDRGEVGAGWAAETAAATEATTGTLEKINIPVHELAAQPKASQRLLDDAAFDVETWLAGRIAEKFARSESAAFVSGNGVDKPKGVLAYNAVANGSWSWGNLGYVATGAAGALTTIDPLVDLVYALPAQYRARACFVMNSRTTGVLRKLKDADGRFLWSDGMMAGEPARLMGYKVLICEDMPDIAANSLSIAFGDFQAGYTIAERPDLRVLRDPYSAKPHVLFYATKRVGGGVTDFGAIKLLKFAAS